MPPGRIENGDPSPNSQPAPAPAAKAGEGAAPAHAVRMQSDVQRRARGAKRKADLIQRWALPVAWLILIAVFGAIRPTTFLSPQNFSSLLGSQATLVVLTLGLLLPLTTGDYDLSIAGMLGLSAMLIAVLNVRYHWPVQYAIIVALAAGVLVGAVNSFVAIGFNIDTLIVTLGMGTLLNGVTLWVSNSATISGVSDALVNAVVGGTLLGIPLEFYYGLAVCIGVWYLFQYTSVGRRMLFVGRGRQVARLSGINVDRIRFGTLIASGVLAALAGILYVGTSSAANPGAGDPLLLPAFAAAFLGATSVVPGRFNPWGTIIAVYFLTTGITGLSLLGISSFVQNLFYGGALILAVLLAQLVRRRYVSDEE
jgi:ribose transport system permease protein